MKLKIIIYTTITFFIISCNVNKTTGICVSWDYNKNRFIDQKCQLGLLYQGIYLEDIEYKKDSIFIDARFTVDDVNYFKPIEGKKYILLVDDKGLIVDTLYQTVELDPLINLRIRKNKNHYLITKSDDMNLGQKLILNKFQKCSICREK